MPMKCWWVVGILVLKEVSIGIMTLLTLHHTGMVYGAGWYGKLCTAVIYLSMFVLMLWRTAPDWFLYADAALCACLILLAFVKYAIRYGGASSAARPAEPCRSSRQAAARRRSSAASAGRYSYGELEYDRGPLMEGLHKEEGSAEFVLPSFI